MVHGPGVPKSTKEGPKVHFVENRPVLAALKARGFRRDFPVGGEPVIFTYNEGDAFGVAR